MALTRRAGPANVTSVMKFIKTLSSLSLLGLAACGSISQPVDGSGDFDPLRAPGNFNKPSQTAGSSFVAGQFVHAAIENTAFFKERPKGDADADKLLKQGTSMKVISISGSYVKVELDSGEVGFVPSVMLEDPSVWLDVSTPNTGEQQVYPPLPEGELGEPLPGLDPAGLPPAGSIPQVIDPDAPADAPVPAVTPSTQTFPAPAPNSEISPPAGEQED